MSIPVHALQDGYIAFEAFRLIVTIGVVGFCLSTLLIFQSRAAAARAAKPKKVKAK